MLGYFRADNEIESTDRQWPRQIHGSDLFCHMLRGAVDGVGRPIHTDHGFASLGEPGDKKTIPAAEIENGAEIHEPVYRIGNEVVLGAPRKMLLKEGAVISCGDIHAGSP